MSDERETGEFDDLLLVALAKAVTPVEPRPAVRQQILSTIARADGSTPRGFAFRFDADQDWQPHPVPGIKMKVLSLNGKAGYATLLLDVAPDTHFPPHEHHAAEECYVVSGSLFTCGRKFVAGEFIHADAETEHGELYTEEGCRVLLVVEPEDYMVLGP